MLNPVNSHLADQAGLTCIANATLVLIPASNVEFAQSAYGLGALSSWKKTAVRWILDAKYVGEM